MTLGEYLDKYDFNKLLTSVRAQRLVINTLRAQLGTGDIFDDAYKLTELEVLKSGYFKDLNTLMLLGQGHLSIVRYQKLQSIVNTMRNEVQ